MVRYFLLLGVLLLSVGTAHSQVPSLAGNSGLDKILNLCAEDAEGCKDFSKLLQCTRYMSVCDASCPQHSDSACAAQKALLEQALKNQKFVAQICAKGLGNAQICRCRENHLNPGCRPPLKENFDGDIWGPFRIGQPLALGGGNNMLGAGASGLTILPLELNGTSAEANGTGATAGGSKGLIVIAQSERVLLDPAALAGLPADDIGVLGDVVIVNRPKFCDLATQGLWGDGEIPPVCQ